MIDLPVEFIWQESDSDCWYASLALLVRYHRAANATFIGFPAVRAEGIARNQARKAVREAEDRGEITGYEEREQLKALPLRGLNVDEFPEFARLNGLVAPPLPERDKLRGTGGWTGAQLEKLLRDHGPLW